MASIDLFNAPESDQLRSCALDGMMLATQQLCNLTSCLCQTHGLSLNLKAVSTEVDSQCSNTGYDATSAMYAVIAYCTVRGYTVASSLASITTTGMFVRFIVGSANGHTIMLGNNQSLTVYEAPVRYLPAHTMH
jgi:ethanolamine transporter EutH